MVVQCEWFSIAETLVIRTFKKAIKPKLTGSKSNLIDKFQYTWSILYKRTDAFTVPGTKPQTFQLEIFCHKIVLIETSMSYIKPTVLEIYEFDGHDQSKLKARKQILTMQKHKDSNTSINTNDFPKEHTAATKSRWPKLLWKHSCQKLPRNMNSARFFKSQM